MLEVVPDVFMAGSTAEVGEIRGLTGDTAIERGTGDEEIGVGVVLPLLGCNKQSTSDFMRSTINYLLVHSPWLALHEKACGISG